MLGNGDFSSSLYSDRLDQQSMPLVSVMGTDDNDDQMLMVATRMMMKSMKVVVVWGPMGSVASCGADVVGPVLQFYSGRAAVGR